ncbi:MAG: O-antigen ligase family protein [Gammaproteobacteria bacterium]
MTRSSSRMVLLLGLLALAVTLITFSMTLHWPDKGSYLAAMLPLGLVVIFLSMTYPQLVMLALVALIPLDTFAYLSDFTQMLTLMKVLFPFALVGLLLGRLVNRFEAPSPHPIDWWVLLWIGLNALLIINAVDTEAALTFVRRLISMGLFYYVLSRVFSNPQWHKRLQATLIYSAAISVGFGLFAYISGQNPFMEGYEFDAVRITGASHISPNRYSIMLLLPMMLAASTIFNATSLKRQSINIGLVLLFITGIALSFSRSGFLAFAVTAVLALILWRNRISARQWIGITAILIMTLPFLPTEFWQRIGSLNVFGKDAVVEESLSGRLNYIRVGKNIVQTYPLLGAGPGNFKVLHSMAEFQTIPTMIGVQRLPHNVYLQTVTETGLVGLTVLLGMLASVFMCALKAFRASVNISLLAGALLLALCGYMIMGLFAHLMLNKYLWVLFAMIRTLPELNRYESKANHTDLPAA